ncbi:RNA polymerase subunit sigma, partial [Nocardia nova]|nr:RNA polymerase subunit sigma [Nocardia nova]
MATQRTTATTRTGRRQDNPALSESRRISAELNTLIGPAAAGDSRAISDVLRLIHPLVYR